MDDMDDKTKLLAHSDSVPDPDNPRTELHVITYKLSDRMGTTEERDLNVGIDWYTREVCPDLILIDITAGEPAWLEKVLRSYNGFGSPLHFIGTSSEGAMEAMKGARSSNAEFLAKRLGY